MDIAEEEGLVPPIAVSNIETGLSTVVLVITNASSAGVTSAEI